VAERTPYLPVASHHSRDWVGCIIVMIGLLDLFFNVALRT